MCEEFKEIYHDENESGIYTAYSDYSIRIKFPDWTILWMKQGNDTARIITSLGQTVETHIMKALQY